MHPLWPSRRVHGVPFPVRTCGPFESCLFDFIRRVFGTLLADIAFSEDMRAVVSCGACPCAELASLKAGGIIGSTAKLLDELIEVAPSLGIALEQNDSLSDAEAARLYSIASTQGAEREAEIKAWLALHQTAELSLSYGTAIFFE